MFGYCIKLTSLNISSFDTNNCKNFNDMFIDDDGLKLYIDSRICSNLVKEIPTFVDVVDISKN